MADYRLKPNEAMILRESGVYLEGPLSGYAEELILTSLNLVCICKAKGLFTLAKEAHVYPLGQIKRFKGNPQVMMGRVGSSPTLDVYLASGDCLSVRFVSSKKRNIRKWAKAIVDVIGGHIDQSIISSGSDSGSLAGAIRDAGSQLREAGGELLGALGIEPGGTAAGAASANGGSGKQTSWKCCSCSAPLRGRRGQTVRCEYCDTEQTL